MKIKNRIVLVAIVSFFLFVVPSIRAGEKPQIRRDVVGQVQIKKSNPRLFWLVPCAESKKSELCIADNLPAGITITVLGKGKQRFCKVKTTGIRTMIPGEDQDEEGFKLANINCPADVRYVSGIIGEVTDYEELGYKRVTEPTLLKRIDSQIRALKIFKPLYYERAKGYNDEKGKQIELFKGLPEVYEYPFPNAEIYFARYGYFSPLVLFINGKSKVLIENIHLCCDNDHVDAFRLNNRYYFRVSECPEQELPECYSTTYEIITEGKRP
jgi:hypothetical protein